jgi:hypothetical protein
LLRNAQENKIFDDCGTGTRRSEEKRSSGDSWNAEKMRKDSEDPEKLTPSVGQLGVGSWELGVSLGT